MDNFVIGTIQENIKTLSHSLQLLSFDAPSKLSDLSDVSSTTPVDGDTLVYNATDDIFEPRAQSGGGLSTEYTNGTGVSISASNEISIGQPVGAGDSPSFTQMSLGTTGVNQGILNLQDFTNIGTDTISQIKGIKEGTNGGQIEFFTKEDGGSITKKMYIKQDGKTIIDRTLTIGPENPEGWSLVINGSSAASTGIGLCRNGQEQIGSMYISGNPGKDLVIDAQSPETNMGIIFRTGEGFDRLRINNVGAFGIGGANYGTAGQVLSSNGSGSAVSWVNPTSTISDDIYDLLYPVNSVKIMYAVWGGFPGQTWVEFGQGRTFVGLNPGDTDFDTIGETGGAKTHTLTQAEMPSHTHEQQEHRHLQLQSTAIGGGNQITGSTADGTGTAANGYTDYEIAVNNNTGGNQPHNNLQPYIVVYYYRRTA